MAPYSFSLLYFFLAGVSKRYESTIVSKPSTSEIDISRFEEEEEHVNYPNTTNATKIHHSPARQQNDQHNRQQNDHATHCVNSRKEIGFTNQAVVPDTSDIDAGIIAVTRNVLTSPVSTLASFAHLDEEKSDLTSYNV